MSQPPASSLRVLHAVRLLGFADSAAIADRAETDRAETARMLLEAERDGLVQHAAFSDLSGWSLTDEGRAENERRLARERELADPAQVVAAVHRDFLPLNRRLLKACTDWQIRPTASDAFAGNDHSDAAWDGRVLDELAALSEALPPLIARLTEVLPRYAGYDTRFAAALRKAQSGQHDWVDKTRVDSCHRVWFQLHEDLIATLGIDRGAEGTDHAA